jgi:AAA-like domain
MMNLDQGLEITNETLFLKKGRRLSEVEIAILKGSWEQQTYEEISVNTCYSLNYLKQDVGPKLWRLLSEVFNEKVSKINFQFSIERQYRSQLNLGMEGNKHPISGEKEDETRESHFRSDSDRDSRSQQLELNKNEGTAWDTSFSPLFYVERIPFESECYEAILQDGALIRVKGSQQTGKTWLVSKMIVKLALVNYRVANISFKLADSQIHFSTLDKFLRWFCNNTTLQLGLPNRLEDYWDEKGLGSKVSCTIFFEEYLLPQTDTPLVLCLDDVDWIFPYPEIYEDFFALLRSWHEKAMSRKRIWTQLRLVVIHSTEVYIRLNIDRSPFNVGMSVELSDFSRQQVQDLSQQYGLTWNADCVIQLMERVGGHPFLVQQALTYLKTHPGTTLAQFLETASTESGIYNHHLRDQLLNLRKHPDLLIAFKTVVATEDYVRLESIQSYKLHSMGLVKLHGNEVKPRCNLYRQYFRDRLGDI